jgi:CRP/FNR family cyclic AMP-dependent transcriptional regulator
MAIIDYLPKSSIFDGLPQSGLKSLLPFCREQTFKKGDYIFREGEKADELYVVMLGQVQLEMKVIQPARRFRGDIAITTIGSLQPIAFWALISPYKYTLSAKALQDVFCIAIDCIDLREKMDTDDKFGNGIRRNLNQLLATRLQQVKEVLAYERAYR